MKLTGNAAYRTEAHASFDPPFLGNKESTTVIEGRHLGRASRDSNPAN